MVLRLTKKKIKWNSTYRFFNNLQKLYTFRLYAYIKLVLSTQRGKLIYSTLNIVPPFENQLRTSSNPWHVFTCPIGDMAGMGAMCHHMPPHNHQLCTLNHKGWLGLRVHCLGSARTALNFMSKQRNHPFSHEVVSNTRVQ